MSEKTEKLIQAILIGVLAFTINFTIIFSLVKYEVGQKVEKKFSERKVWNPYGPETKYIFKETQEGNVSIQSKE